MRLYAATSRRSATRPPRAENGEYLDAEPHVIVEQLLSGRSRETGLEQRGRVLAERVGFEPTRQLAPPTRFPVALLKPLGHLSDRHKGIRRLATSVPAPRAGARALSPCPPPRTRGR